MAPTPVLFGLLGGGAAWGLHLTLAYSMQEISCDTGLAELEALGLNGYVWVLAGLTAGLALVALAAGLFAYRGWRRARSGGEGTATERRRGQALGAAGMLLDSIFLAAILLGGVSATMLEPCGPG